MDEVTEIQEDDLLAITAAAILSKYIETHL